MIGKEKTVSGSEHAAFCGPALKSEGCLGVLEMADVEDSGHEIEGFEGFIDGKEHFFVVGLELLDGGLLSDELSDVVPNRALRNGELIGKMDVGDWDEELFLELVECEEDEELLFG